MMRALLWITTALMLLWSGYWFAGKAAGERGFAAFLQEAPARGLDVSQSGYDIAGFPNRFDLTVNSPVVTDQASRITWEAPFVQVLTLSYKPWHVIAAFAPEQIIRTPAEDISLQSQKLQASVVVAPTSSLSLDRSTFVGNEMRLESSLGWTLAADQIRLATRLDETRSNAHVIGLEMLGLTPDPALSSRVPELPPQLAVVRLDATVGLSSPLDRFAAQLRPEVTTLSLREGLVAWGDMTIFASGDLAVVNDMPEGRITIRVTGWRSLVSLATGLGLVKPEVAPTALGMMQALATSSGDENVLEMPLVFTDGRMMLGPLPLGPAPRLGQRQ
jgi:hypothetical protein